MRVSLAVRPVCRIILVFIGCGALLGFIGCGSTLGNISIAPTANPALTGHVHGGQQPVSGARVYLYAASTIANAGTAASLLAGSGFVTTDGNGTFSISGDYTCPASAYVYLLAVGGNPGLAGNINNSALVLAAAVGPCAALSPSSFITINEVTTVAAVYSLAAFANSETQVGAIDTTALGNAFANIPNLIDPAAGTALATTPTGSGIVPQAKIDSLANSIAPCVNSDGTGAPCSVLMSAASVSSGGGTPVDTFQAALNIVHNPTANVSTIYNLATPVSPFQPALGSTPGDWTFSIQYTTVDAYHAYGDSITYGATLSSTSLAYPSLIATDRHLALSDYAIPGDQACDVPTLQIFPNNDNPTAEPFPLYTLLIGTNDVDNRGAQDFMTNVFNLCQQASIAWLALPADLKVLATSPGVVLSGPGSINPAHNWNAWATSIPNSSITFPITLSASGSIYAWVRIADNDGGTFSYAVDGVVLGTMNTTTTPYMITLSGNTESIGFLRIPGVAAGSHSVTFTQTSTTGTMQIVAIGAPPGTKRSLPTVVVGDIPNQEAIPGDECVVYPVNCLSYPPDIQATVAMFAGDGLNVIYAENHTYMFGTANEMNDELHPNVLGQSELRNAFEAVIP